MYRTLNLDSYHIFHVAGQYSSFSEAARKLFMTQSAVSQAIRNLETELGVQLFHRTPRGVKLTDEGKMIHEYVGAALNLLRTAEEKIDEVRMLKSGQLRLGVGDTISRYFLLPYFEKFHSRHPGVNLEIQNGTTQEIIELIKAGEVDIGICNLPVDDERLEVYPIKDIQDVFVCGEKYKRITEQPVTFEYLMKLPLIFLEKKSNSRRYVENFLKEKGFDLEPRFELGSYDLVLEFARINMGISCVVREFTKGYLEKGILYEVPLVEPIPKRQIGIVCLQSVPMYHAAVKFMELIIR